MLNRPTKETLSEFPADLSALERMREVARRSLSDTRLPEREITQVCLALEEAASNIVRHAYQGGAGQIKLKIVTYARRVVISLIDHGRPYFPEETPSVSLSRMVETSRKGGLGQLMIQRLMDDVQYIVGDDYNELRMHKALPRALGASNQLKGRAISLRTRFSLATGAIVLLIIAGSYYFMETRIVAGVADKQRENMTALGRSAAALAGSYVLNGRTYVEFDELAYSLSSQTSDIKRVTIVDTTGLILADSRDIKLLRRPYAPPGGISEPFEGAVELRAEAAEFSYVRLPIAVQGRALGSIALEFTDESLAAEIAGARTATLIVIGVELLIGLLGIYLLSNYFVKPILDITEQVRRFGERREISEAPVEGAAEFFEISRALNEMMTRHKRESAQELERERLLKEIEVAGEIQKTMLPERLPEIPGLDLSAFYRAAAQVGGDLYDVFALDESKYCLIVADVSGKGVPASLVMSSLRTVVRLTAPTSGSPSAILRAVEAHLMSDIPTGLFITVALAVYDSASGELRFASAGHNPLILVSPERADYRLLNPRGAPLGLGALSSSADDPYAEESAILLDGEILCLYTDGISELANAEGARLGPGGIADALRAGEGGVDRGSAAALVETLISTLDGYRGAVEPGDDMTVLIARSSVGERVADDG